MSFQRSSIFSILLAITLVGCCAEAGIERYGNFEQNKQGFDDMCVVQYLTSKVSEALVGENLADVLKADAQELQEAISRRSEFGQCSEYCLAKKYQYAAKDMSYVRSELDVERCVSFFEYDTLCTLITDRKFDDPKVLKVQKFVCETRDNTGMHQDEAHRKCGETKWIGVKVAERNFYDIVFYNDQQVEELRKSLEPEFASFKERLVAQEEKKLTDLVRWITNSTKNTGFEYRGCHKAELQREADEKEQAAKEQEAKELAAKKRSPKGIFKKIFPRVGRSSNVKE